MRSYVNDNADQSACASCMMQCLRCDACSRASVPACDAYVAYDACRHAMHTSAYWRLRCIRACVQSAGRACYAGEAVMHETLTVHNCMRAREPANDVTLPMTPASMRCLHLRPANGGARTHNAMNAMHTSSACDAKIAPPALHGMHEMHAHLQGRRSKGVPVRACVLPACRGGG